MPSLSLPWTLKRLSCLRSRGGSTLTNKRSYFALSSERRRVTRDGLDVKKSRSNPVARDSCNLLEEEEKREKQRLDNLFCARYRKIPKVSPGLIFVQKTFSLGFFWGSFFLRGLLLEGILSLKMG